MTAPAPGTPEIASLEDVRPGDLFFAGMSGAPAKALVYAGQLALGEFVAVGGFVVGHVGVVTEASRRLPPGSTHRGQIYETGVITAPRMVEAMPAGARERDLSLGRDWTRRTAFVRLPETYPGQRDDAAAIARLMIGTPYSFGSYAQLAAWRFGWKTWRLEERINRRRAEIDYVHGAAGTIKIALPQEAICSVLADQAWSLAGARVVYGTKPQIVTPGLLASQLMHRPGVVWGGAGILG